MRGFSPWRCGTLKFYSFFKQWVRRYELVFRTSRLFLCTNMCFVFSYTHTSFEGSIIFAFFTEHTAASRFQRVAHRHQLIEVSFVFPFMNIYMLLYNTYTSLKKHTILIFSCLWTSRVRRCGKQHLSHECTRWSQLRICVAYWLLITNHFKTLMFLTLSSNTHSFLFLFLYSMCGWLIYIIYRFTITCSSKVHSCKCIQRTCTTSTSFFFFCPQQ